MTNSRYVLWLILSFLTASCGSVSPTPVRVSYPSATGTHTLTVSSTGTALPPTLTPTLQAFSGLLTVQVNVRSGPGSGYESLGLLAAGQEVQVTSLSAEAAWYRIQYSSAPDGTGWVAAQYVSFAAGTPFFLTATAQPGTAGGVILQRLNVRSGPGITFDSLGMLEAGMTVLLTAKNTTASWFQIAYPPGMETRGWVTAQFVQTDHASVLPVMDETGQPVNTSTPGPSPIPMTATPTIGPAVGDGDSLLHPAIIVTFSSAGTRMFTYSSQVSNPEGDGEDWLEFRPFASLPGGNARLLVSLSCIGNGVLVVELWQAQAALRDWGTLLCGDKQRELSLPVGATYQVRLQLLAGEGLRSSQYTLTVQNLP